MSPRRSRSKGRRRRLVDGAPDGGDGGDGKSEKLSCRSFQSCAAAAVADSIAVCCCPCAVVSFLALALVKAPWAAGRRCLRALRRRSGALGKTQAVEGTWMGGERSKEKEMEKRRRTEKALQIGMGEGGGGGEGFWRELAEERVWKEMYELGFWGFGRVSISVTSHVANFLPDINPVTGDPNLTPL
ncbi:hypothetical protein AXF42_Ash017174 [Apostasia shenzhenica]|uniref:Uncharacterized protein n=1 Tax=Apostasia shenzhenica TaxID=1088818 RepID=A0A2H9ZV96_9ASPA|nr:hypothetical protein AXF42_Ash017174 [Apostasia shenzhenica]